MSTSIHFPFQRSSSVPTAAVMGLRRAVGWDADATRYAKLQQAAHTQFAYWHDDVLVAFALVLDDNRGNAWLLDVAVHPKHQRQGIGHSLVRQVVGAMAADGFQRVCVTCTPDLMPFYEQCGFTDKGANSNGDEQLATIEF